jgi:hypothetical protein
MPPFTHHPRGMRMRTTGRGHLGFAAVEVIVYEGCPRAGSLLPLIATCYCLVLSHADTADVR